MQQYRGRFDLRISSAVQQHNSCAKEQFAQNWSSVLSAPYCILPTEELVIKCPPPAKDLKTDIQQILDSLHMW